MASHTKQGGESHHANFHGDSKYNKTPKSRGNSLLPVLIIGGVLCLAVGLWAFGGLGGRNDAYDSFDDDLQARQNEAQVFA